jgi:hypothetical protein
MRRIPEEVRSVVTGQLGLLWDSLDGYSWDGGKAQLNRANTQRKNAGIGMRMSATTRFRLLIRTAYSSEPAEAQKTVDATAIQSDQVEAALVASKTVWISPVLRCMRHWQEAVRSSARATTA